MGNCFGKREREEKTAPAPKIRQRRGASKSREESWERTGIVALSDQRLKELPPSLERLAPEIKVLDASGNRIGALPAYLARAAALTRLVLSRNALADIPRELGALAHLRVLFLDHNRLAELPGGADFWGGLARLERLSVAHNRLAALPPALGRLPRLRQLDATANALTALPPELGGAAALEELDVGQNRLAALPAELGRLAHLKKLVADGNAIAAVPPALLEGCAELQTLSLYDCPLTMRDLEATAGFAAFEERRQRKFSKSIALGVLLGPRGTAEAAARDAA